MNYVSREGYWDEHRRLRVLDKDILHTYADTGWYDSKTNMDKEPPETGIGRYRFVTLKGVSDPVMISEWVSVTTPGFTMNMRTFAIKKVDAEPYIERTGMVRHGLYHMKHLIDPKNRGRYSHPRFTAAKACVREIEKVAKRRTAAAQKYEAKLEKQYPVNLTKIEGPGV